MRGVPLRRLNQAYVIATSTNVDISAVNVDAVTDAFFARNADASASREEQFNNGAAKAIVSDERRSTQERVDKEMAAGIAAVDLLSDYLKAKFSLRTGQFPHAMKF